MQRIIKKGRKGWNPNLHPLRHQGWRFLANGLFPDCRKCVHAKVCPKYEPEPKNGCMIYRPLMEKRVRNILRLPWVKPYDIDSVRAFAKAQTFLDIIDNYIEATGGPITEKGDVVPMLQKMRWVVENNATRLAQQLLLTPASRAQAGLDRKKFSDIEDVEAYLWEAAGSKPGAVAPADQTDKEPPT